MSTAIEGLRDIEFGEKFNANAGSKFALPPGFDSNRFASKWAVEDIGVQEAEQDTILPFAGKVAEGWKVYLTTEKPKLDESKPASKLSTPKPVIRVAGKTRFVLMFRPKALQRALNGLYAQESRRITNQEIVGESVRANAEGDPGILSNQDLRQAQRMDHGDDPTPLPPTIIQSTDPNTASNLELK